MAGKRTGGKAYGQDKRLKEKAKDTPGSRLSPGVLLLEKDSSFL